MASLPSALANTPDLAEVARRLSARSRPEHFYVALLGLRDYRPIKIYAQLRKGLAFTAFERFQRNTALGAAQLAGLIQLPSRTLARRKQAGRLEPEESDRLLRVARVFGRALELFDGDPDAAHHWLSSKQPLLGNLVPLELAGTDLGALEVERLIGRIEHGIPAQPGVISAWRISKTRYARGAFDGEGARLHGGRWNSRGTRVAYASESVALATLEVLVGLQDAGVLSGYSLIRVEFPERLIEVFDRSALPSSWKQHPPSPETQRVGDLWVAENRSAVLKVPSAIVEAEHNYLINPVHRDFKHVVVHRPERFRLDPRLVK